MVILWSVCKQMVFILWYYMYPLYQVGLMNPCYQSDPGRRGRRPAHAGWTPRDPSPGKQMAEIKDDVYPLVNKHSY